MTRDSAYAWTGALGAAALVVIVGMPISTAATSSVGADLAARLSDALGRSLEESAAPGVQAAVVLGDGRTWTAGAGISTPDQPMTTDLLMAIASITKLYTVTLTLDLADKGLLALDDPLTRWVPDAPHAEGVTIRQLLTHTSGIASDDPALTPVCEPGTCHSYSNGAFHHLGRIIEQASGLTYAEALRQHVLAPLGLNATFYPRQEQAIGGSAIGHAADDAVSAVEVATLGDGPGWQGASGAIVATASDTALFAHALFGGRLLSSAGLRTMIDFEATRGLPGTSDCGAGAMNIGRHSGDLGDSWFVGGLAGYFRSWVEHYPAQGITVAVITNADVPLGPFIEALAHEASADSPAKPTYPSGTCNQDIAVRSADGTVRLVTSDPGFDGFPSWSPDGLSLTWSGLRNDQQDIYVAHADGSSPLRLTADAARDLFPRWSPDGSTIAFTSDRDGDFEIFLMASDGSDVRQLTYDTWDEWLPTWSPDGSQLAYVSIRDGQHIRVMAADGGDDRAVTAGAGREWWPTWAPDGQRLAYESGGVIFIVPLAGGEPVRLPIPQIRVTMFPAWYPGTDIAFSSDGDLYATHEDGTNLRRLTTTSTSEELPAWSPHGSSIVFQVSHWETLE